MTNDQINRAIAEACGWSQVGHNGYQPVWANSKGERWAESHLPDYANDLNAMHEVEELLSDLEYDLFLGSLIELCIVVGRERINSATASERAEAFLRTIGKWEEVQP